jgi:hypothetical protein
VSTGYWSTTRPNGTPIEPGTVCWVTEVEGQNPIYTYGKDQGEVIEKLNRTAATAQAELARTRAARSTPTQPLAPRPRLSADEVMQATSDLGNPSKAPAAIVRLVQDETGVDLRAQANKDYAARAMEWQRETPEFFFHPGNQRLLTAEAARLAGGDITRITKEVLTQAFHNLDARGELFHAPENSFESDPPPPLTFPGGSPVQRTEERPRGARFATGTRSTTLRGGGPGTAPKTPKYTAEQIRKMPEAKERELIQSNDRDYQESCEYWFGESASA